MAKHKQALKRHKQSIVKRDRNRSVTSSLRTIVKEARATIEAGKPDEVVVKKATKAFDKAASKGVLHKRTAARRVSRLTKATNRAKAATSK